MERTYTVPRLSLVHADATPSAGLKLPSRNAFASVTGTSIAGTCGRAAWSGSTSCHITKARVSSMPGPMPKRLFSRSSGRSGKAPAA